MGINAGPCPYRIRYLLRPRAGACPADVFSECGEIALFYRLEPCDPATGCGWHVVIRNGDGRLARLLYWLRIDPAQTTYPDGAPRSAR